MSKFSFLLFVMFSLGAFETITAQDIAQIQFDAKIAIRNHPARAWLPIVAVVENLGEKESFEADLVAITSSTVSGSGESIATRRISVAAKSKKKFYLYLNIQGRMVSKVEVCLQRKGEYLVGTRRTLQFSFRYDSVFIEVLSDVPTVPTLPADINVAIGRRGLHVEADLLEIDLLPESWVGYSAVDLLIINDLPLDKLTENQKRAIIDWVRSGGRVVISSGEQSWLKSDFVQNLVPMEVVDVSVPKHITAIEKRFGRFNYGRPSFHKVKIKSKCLWQINNKNGFPEIAEVHSGFGKVIFLAFDIRESPFPGWSGASKMWQEIFRRMELQSEQIYWRIGKQFSYYFDNLWNSTPSSRYGRYIVNSIHDAQRGEVSKLPSMGVIIIVVVFYLIVVGPANYLLLKKFNRSIYTVATIPFIALVFVGLVFSIGYITKGVSTIYQKVSLIEIPPAADFGREICFFSLFSAGSTDYDISFDKYTAPERVYESFSTRRNTTMVIDETNGMMIKNHRLKMWSLGMFKSRSIQPMGGIIEKRQGMLRNFTNYDLKNCLLIDGSEVCKVGTIPRGGDPVRIKQPVHVSRTMQSFLSYWLGAEESEFNRKLAATLYDRCKRVRSGSVLLGFLEDDPSAPKINRRVRKQKDITIVIVYLDALKRN